MDSIVGSRPRDTGMRNPIVSVTTWAAVPNDDNPQKGAADELAAIVWEWTYAAPFLPVRVRQGTSYRYADVHSVFGVQEPRFIPDPADESRARYTQEIGIQWTEVPE